MLFCTPFSVPAEEIIWNGPGNPANTGEVRPDIWGNDALYPDVPSNNSVIVNGDVPGYVYGGAAASGSGTATVSGNSVSIRGSKTQSVIGGVAASDSGTATASGNSVSIANSTANFVHGGRAASDSGTATASGNSVSIGDSTVNAVYGGYALSFSGTATASGNSVSIRGSKTQSVYGGAAGSVSGTATVTASDNSVSIGDSTMKDVYGGAAASDSGTATATASGNSISIRDSKTQSVNGGATVSTSGTATASGNSVSIGGSTVNYVYGGTAASDSGTATATGNSVSIGDSTVNSVVYGGFALSLSGTATASDNSVSIRGSKTQSVYGGVAASGSGTATVTASGNSVSIANSTVKDVYGGAAASGSGTATVTASDNSVSIANSTVKDVYGGTASSVSGAGTATASDNSVSIANSTANAVYGGFAVSDSGTATASGNSVSIGDSTVNSVVYGGAAGSVSGTGTATATGNSVSIANSTVKDVYGGAAASVSGTATATASGNSVSIANSTADTVYGGLAMSDSGTATASGNSVTLYGTSQLANSDIWGGHASSSSILAGDGFSGNTLNVSDYRGGAVKSVQNFEFYNFMLPASLKKGDSMLTVGDAYFDGSAQDSSSPSYAGVSQIAGVNIAGGGTALGAGDQVVLMQYTAGHGTIGNNGAILSGKKGISLFYDFQVNQTATELTATVIGNPRLNPQTKALSEGRMAGLAFVNQGGDLVAGAGMQAARSTGVGTVGLVPFMVGQVGTSRYDTGSHVDVDGFSMMAGLAWNKDTDYGKLLLGAFFEGGWGNYDSHNAFSGHASIKGDGDTEYYGGGILGRFDFNNTGPGNIYTEASFRAGWSETDFSSGDLRDLMGNKADYDSGAAYYGIHLGLGYDRQINEALNLDMYTKYFWTHQDSDSVSVAGDPVKFKAADSHRWRAGARMSHAISSENGLVFTPYLGAAYEHEFDGKAKATVYGRSLDKPDLAGGTGIGELGLTFKPVADSGFSLDLGVQGYLGVREGVTGSLQFKFEF